MKQLFLCVWIMLIGTAIAQSQVKSNQKSRQAYKAAGTRHVTKQAALNSESTINLISTTAHPAKANLTTPPTANAYTISDPVLKAFNARANGANLKINRSGIFGMPKRAYGFYNGHLTLRSSGAVTAGTQTGSGSVATGSSLGTFGSSGPGMEVNGKSPYAGTIMWGNAFNLYLPQVDSLTRTKPSKRQ